jgi:hypothetical protein
MFEDLGMDFAKLIGSDAAPGSSGKTISAPASVAASAPPVSSETQAVTLYGAADEELMIIRCIERDGDDLVVKGEAFGAMPLVAKLNPEQGRRIFGLLKLSLIPFLLSFLFRRSKRSAST